MKKLLIISLAFISTFIYCQAPNSFNYQAVLRNGDGTINANASVTVNITILQTNPTGTEVFSESHSVTTNSYGLVNLQIGSVNTTDLATIDWSDGPYFLKISVDGIELGTIQLLSVPYALHANSADNVFSGDYNDLDNQPDFTGWDNNESDDFDGDYNSLNNLPDLGLKLDTSNTAGWDKNASDDFDGDYNNLSNTPVNVSAFNNDAGYITMEQDSSTTNELIKSINLNGTNLEITDSAGIHSVDLASLQNVNQIMDEDQDTKIQVEESTNEDIIRFDIAGTEQWKMEGPRLVPENTGYSVLLVEMPD